MVNVFPKLLQHNRHMPTLYLPGLIPYSGFLSRGINNCVRWYVAVLKSAVFNAPLLIVTWEIVKTACHCRRMLLWDYIKRKGINNKIIMIIVILWSLTTLDGMQYIPFQLLISVILTSWMSHVTLNLVLRFYSLLKIYVSCDFYECLW